MKVPLLLVLAILMSKKSANAFCFQKNKAILSVGYARELHELTGSSLRLSNSSKDREERAQIRSREYFQGLLTRPLSEDRERITGDELLGPTLKLAGGVTLILLSLVAAFLASNEVLFPITS
jgi:hypothetical protein